MRNAIRNTAVALAMRLLVMRLLVVALGAFAADDGERNEAKKHEDLSGAMNEAKVPLDRKVTAQAQKQAMAQASPSLASATTAAILEQVAKAYGLDSWDQIQAIRYTWHREITGLSNVAHAWVWEPKTNKVSYEGQDKDGKPLKVSYMRTELSSQPDVVRNDTDPAFINDNYWLLFTFHAYWATTATVTDQGIHKMPVGNGSAQLVTVKYPEEGGGYTPLDTWELYVGKDHRVQQLVYHRGGPKKPSLVIATWTGYKKAGPLLISTEHHGTADGKPLHIFLSDVAVKLTGSDAWEEAE